MGKKVTELTLILRLLCWVCLALELSLFLVDAVVAAWLHPDSILPIRPLEGVEAASTLVELDHDLG